MNKRKRFIFEILFNLYIKKFKYFHANHKHGFYHYMNVIYKILKSGCSFRFVKNFKNTLTYSVYAKFYHKLVNANIFNELYVILIRYRYKFKDINDYKLLFIDSTIIDNKNGSESIDRIYYNKKKKGTKLSIIYDGIYNSVIAVDINKSSVHDLVMMNDNINNSSIKIENCLLIGDKAYISENNKRELFNKRKIIKITPLRKN